MSQFFGRVASFHQNDLFYIYPGCKAVLFVKKTAGILPTIAVTFESIHDTTHASERTRNACNALVETRKRNNVICNNLFNLFIIHTPLRVIEF